MAKIGKSTLILATVTLYDLWLETGAPVAAEQIARRMSRRLDKLRPVLDALVTHGMIAGAFDTSEPRSTSEEYGDRGRRYLPSRRLLWYALKEYEMNPAARVYVAACMILKERGVKS